MGELDAAGQIKVWDQRMPGLKAQTFQPDAKLVELVTDLAISPGRAIDLGCGPGRHLIWLAKQGWQLTGLDWSQRALKQTQQALDEHGLSGKLVQGDCRTPPKFEEPFDLAIATRVFHHGHFCDFQQAVIGLSILLTRDGVAVLSLPSAGLIPQPFRGDWIEQGTFVPTEGEECGVPHHFFTPDEVRQAALDFASVRIDTLTEEYLEQTMQGQALVRREWLWVVLSN